MSWQRVMEQFQEDPDAAYLGLIPVSAVAKSEHELLVIGAVECYTDRAIVSTHLRLGPDHPEHEWRARGRPGHPMLLMRCLDNIGTEYVVMQQGGGGGGSIYRFEQAIAPSFPDKATTLTLEIADIAWNARPPFPPDDLDSITWRWRVDIDLATQIPPRQITGSGNA